MFVLRRVYSTRNTPPDKVRESFITEIIYIEHILHTF